MAQSNLTLNPYLFFGGNCREAMEYYKSVFGGELTMNTYAEGPPDAHEDPKSNSAEMKSKIMHANLAGDVTILASDSPFHIESTAVDQFSLSVAGSDNAKLTAIFEKLSDGGKVTSPLQKQFWGSTFGMCKDKFGINWMISINA